MGWPWYPWQTPQASDRNRLPLLVKESGYVTQLLDNCPHLMKSRFDIGFDGFHYLRGREGVRINQTIWETIPPAKTRTGGGFQHRNLPDLHRSQYWEREAEWLEEELPPSSLLPLVGSRHEPGRTQPHGYAGKSNINTNDTRFRPYTRK